MSLQAVEDFFAGLHFRKVLIVCKDSAHFQKVFDNVPQQKLLEMALGEGHSVDEKNHDKQLTTRRQRCG